MNDLQPVNILHKKAEEIARERAEWIDSTVASWIPAWRMKILKMFPSKLLFKILVGELEIINETLIANFGTRVWIKLNGKVIGSRKYIA